VSLRLFAVIAALFGACGIILGALAAHKAPGSGLDQASQMLLIHAVAMLATVALAERGTLPDGGGRIALIGWTLGTLLFAGDITARALGGFRLFPLAAPTGGSLLIASWLLLAVSAAMGRK